VAEYSDSEDIDLSPRVMEMQPKRIFIQSGSGLEMLKMMDLVYRLHVL
jgi:hypothetical protein